ncbi:hypothetical protein [Peribacillus sp. R9-11]|uniref:hypothetical protein n=1 Tax=Peribacillus sp. R9-11 TaxID=3073271 RepID=UPI0028684BDB|nr:hypothetical protein [Peribacillus sp. R9-11]WMX57430.1 hypothetical protein RE409_09515 [Peribacillus sp. R9-11]
MTTAKLNVLFKKIQKDDKKEVLMFHVQGDELPHANELLKMPGSITMLNVEESEAGEIGAEFISIQRDNKKTVLKFHIKRDVDEKVNKLYPHAGANVSITLQPSQMSIEEFYEEPHEGLEYSVNPDGTANIPSGQIEMDEVVVKH